MQFALSNKNYSLPDLHAAFSCRIIRIWFYSIALDKSTDNHYWIIENEINEAEGCNILLSGVEVLPPSGDGRELREAHN